MVWFSLTKLKGHEGTQTIVRHEHERPTGYVVREQGSPPAPRLTASRRAFDKGLEMLMQLHEKAEQGREQSEPEMEEPDADASAVDSSADAQPGGMPSGTDGSPSQEPPVAAAAPEGSEDETTNPRLAIRAGSTRCERSLRR